MSEREEAILYQVQQWLQQVVVGLNLCPFAAAPLRREQVRFRVFAGADDEQLLQTLQEELQWLDQHPDTETSLLILADHLTEFADYNQFLDWVDAVVVTGGWEGTYQVASFHPDYCFADAAASDVENWTNRSPYPLLHLIREEQLETLLERFPGASDIPETNMATLRQLSETQRQALFPHCFSRCYPPA